jgi:hypothetical protein
MITESVLFKTWLFFKKKRHISNISLVIIGGCPRSGTTLVRALLSTHPNIKSPNQELNILMWINKKNILRNKLGLTDEEIKSLTQYKDHILFAENVIKIYQKKNKNKLIVLKHPYHILIIDELFKFFPKIKFLHIIRDGRDTSCSLRTHPKRKIIKDKIVKIDTKNPFSWCIRRWITCINIGKKCKFSKNYLEIQYEDIVLNTVKTINKITNFLKIEKISEDHINGFYKNQEYKKHIQNIEVSKPLYNKKIGRWKADISKKEKKKFKKMAGDLLIELGYAKDKKW